MRYESAPHPKRLVFGGIIAERGALLSHTAMISRELKKPAMDD